MTTAKSNVFNFFWVELNFGGEGGREKEQIFAFPPVPLVRKTFYIYTYTYIKELCQQVFMYNEEVPYTSHTSCAKVAILLLQDLSTLCVTDRYGIYMFSFVCSVSVRNTINLSRHEHV